MICFIESPHNSLKYSYGNLYFKSGIHLFLFILQEFLAILKNFLVPLQNKRSRVEPRYQNGATINNRRGVVQINRSTPFFSFYHVTILSTIFCCSVADFLRYILVVSMLSCPIRSARKAMSLYFSRKFFANR